MENLEILFDKEKAIKHKENIDKHVADLNDKIKKRNRKRFIIAIVISILIFIIFCPVTYAFVFNLFGQSSKTIFLFIVTSAILFLTVWHVSIDIADGLTEEAEKAEYHYTLDVWYYLITVNKTVLGIKPLYDEIILIIEDMNGNIVEQKLKAKVRFRKDIEQNYFDVDNGIFTAIYEP